MLRDDIEASACDFEQSLSQRQPLTDEIVTAGKIDQEIDVAVRALLAASNGAKDTNTAGTELPACAFDGFLAGAK